MERNKPSNMIELGIEMDRKKFYCKKCKELKNDWEVIWYAEGILCLKCRSKLWLDAQNYNLIKK